MLQLLELASAHLLSLVAQGQEQGIQFIGINVPIMVFVQRVKCPPQVCSLIFPGKSLLQADASCSPAQVQFVQQHPALCAHSVCPYPCCLTGHLHCGTAALNGHCLQQQARCDKSLKSCEKAAGMFFRQSCKAPSQSLRAERPAN